jgi:tetratricopeptide (TPR) repeat protein
MDIAELDIEHLSARLSDNPQSPLFARLAELYLSTERANEALALCEKGVGLYPSYAGGQIMLGRCYSSMGRIGEARTAFHHALDLAPYNTVVQNLLISLPDAVDDDGAAASVSYDGAIRTVGLPFIAASQPEAPQDRASMADASEKELDVQENARATAEPAVGEIEPALPSAPIAEADESVPAPIAAEEPAEPEAPAFEPFPTFEEYIAQHPAGQSVMTLEEYLKGRAPGSVAPETTQPEQTATAAPSMPTHEASTDVESIALKLQNARRIIPADHMLPAPSSAPSDTASGMQPTIVTQTMAEIYAAQKEYQAAIDAYQELIRKQPDQATAFQQRIDAIRLLMGTA